MRVFYASHDQGNLMPSSKTWYNNLYLPLCDVAEEVVRFSYDLFPMAQRQDPASEDNKAFITKERPRLEEALLRQIKEEHGKKGIDVFFSYFASSYCSPEVIREIGKMGILTVNWFCNASYQFYLVKEIAPAYDYCLVPERFRLDDYRALGANPLYFQEAANPNVYRRTAKLQQIEASFVGTRYADRPAYIRHLYNRGIDAHVFGENWQQALGIPREKTGLKNLYRKITGNAPLPQANTHGFLSDAEMIDVFNMSKINLGFSVCGNTHRWEQPIRQVRLRDFEVPMSGGFYLCEKNDELAGFFEPDREVVFFQDKRECAEKSEFYLRNDGARNRIREAAWLRAQGEHTMQRRLSEAFRAMGLK